MTIMTDTTDTTRLTTWRIRFERVTLTPLEIITLTHADPWDHLSDRIYRHAVQHRALTEENGQVWLFTDAQLAYLIEAGGTIGRALIEAS